MPKRTELIISSQRKLLEGGKLAESFAAFALPDDQTKFVVARVRMRTDASISNVQLFTLSESGERTPYDAPISFDQLVHGQVPKNYPLVDVSVIRKFISPDVQI